jgi:hypothetical protein
LLECLKGREDPNSERLLIGFFASAAPLVAVKGEPSGKDVFERLVWVMASASAKVQSALVDAHAKLSAETLGQAFAAACRCRNPAEVFTLFSPYLKAKVDEKKGKRDPAFVKREAVVDRLTGRRRFSGDFNPHNKNDDGSASFDERWLDLAVKLGRADLVMALAVPGHAKANQFLTTQFQQHLGKPGELHECLGILDTLIRIGHPGICDLGVELIKATAKGTSGTMYWAGRLIRQLPKAEAVPKLEALLPTLPEKMIDELLEYLTELKRAP